MTIEYVVNALKEQLNGGTARDFRTQRCPGLAVETTSLAVLALRNYRGPEYLRALDVLLAAQNRDGSWPAFSGDDTQGCWATALALLALTATRHTTADWASGIQWLLNASGREGNWLWRWRFQTVDNRVKFDPAKYGWSWFPGTTSWVIPTAFSVIALRAIKDSDLAPTPRLKERTRLGLGMLLDRMCPGGGWNAGKGVAFGVPYSPYIDATAIALLALAKYEGQPGVQASLRWLASRLPGCRSPYSLAWGILGLTAHRKTIGEVDEILGSATKELIALLEKSDNINDLCTIAVSVLALEAIDGDNVFEVRS